MRLSEQVQRAKTNAIISPSARARHPRRARAVSGQAIRDALALALILVAVWLAFDALREWGRQACADAVREVRVAHYVIRYDPCWEDAPSSSWSPLT